MSRAILRWAGALAVAASGCMEGGIVLYEWPAEEPWVIPLVVNRDLDVLFVVDDSGSMAGEQVSLAANFPSLIHVLETLPGGLPDVHIGVVSSDVGAAGIAGVPGCPGQGDDGNLIRRPICTGITDAFISDVTDDDGNRVRNYTGDLQATFACMAQLGTGGCGFEMHLESMFRALQPGKNPGFYRPGAHLAIVIIADEDDCSTELGAVFGDPTAGLMSPLGPRTSFRCHEFGTTCANDPEPRAFGTKHDCRPAPSSPYLHEIDRYVEFLDTLKYPPAQVMIGGIVGVDDYLHTVTVGPDPMTPANPAVENSCFLVDPLDPLDGAAPPIRLAAAIDRVGEHHEVTSICEPTLELPLTSIGLMIKRGIRDPCVRTAIRDRDPATPGVQYDCSVVEVQHPYDPDRGASSLPACDTPGASKPCWQIVPNPIECPDVEGNLAMDVDRGGAPVPRDGQLEVRCAAPD